MCELMVENETDRKADGNTYEQWFQGTWAREYLRELIPLEGREVSVFLFSRGSGAKE